MTSIADVCASVNDLVKSIGEAIWEFDNICGLLEEARKLHQFLRRIEVLISDTEPFLKGVRVWSSLREIEGTLLALLQLLWDAGAKGPLVQYLQADRILARFSVAAVRLEVSLARLQDETCGGLCTNGATSQPNGSRAYGTDVGGLAAPGAVPDEAREELCSLRGSLQCVRFDLPAAHKANLQRFRQACDGVQTQFQAMVESYGEMMDHTMQERLLSKECFGAAISQLQQEVELQQHVLQRGQQPSARSASCDGAARDQQGQGHPQLGLEQARRCEAEQHYLRMLMDVVRAYHINTDSEAPLDYLCPLTHQLMQDPVLLHETGHSYERKALEGWWAKGNHFCPRTGVHLRRLNTSPNHNLRSAIERWRLHNDMHLSFRPVLNTLALQQRQQSRKATRCRQLEERLLQMASREGVLDLVQEGEQGFAGNEGPGNQQRQGMVGGLDNGQQAGGVRSPEAASCCTYAPSTQEHGNRPAAPITIEPLKAVVLVQGSPVGVDAERALSAAAFELSDSGAVSEGTTGRCSPRIYTPQRATSQELEVAGFNPYYADGKSAAAVDALSLASSGCSGEAAGTAGDATAPVAICRINEPANFRQVPGSCSA